MFPNPKFVHARLQIINKKANIILCSLFCTVPIELCASHFQTENRTAEIAQKLAARISRGQSRSVS